MKKLTYDKNGFYLSGKPFRILSGTIHYFRIPKEEYRDRLTKLRDMGLNTVETYCAWNIHEKREGVFEFDGLFDLACFLDCASSLGLYAIVRPGPYICAEWDLGGQPAWLLSKDGLTIRANDEGYLFYVRRYFEKLFDIVRPRLYENGGNVILMQIENEYGSYGTDKEYLKAVKALYSDLNMSVTLFTSDGPLPEMLRDGTLPDVLPTVNFGSDPAGALKTFRDAFPDAPLMCTEFWDGWFDHWGDTHHVRTPEETAQCFDEMLSLGFSVNFYVFCGGTNFGFMNGANIEEGFWPTVTSYDYDALLDETGRRTPKYYACRDVICKHLGFIPKPDLPEIPPVSYGSVTLTQSCYLFDMLSQGVISDTLITAEQAGALYGYVLYSSEAERGMLTVSGVHDRAYIYLNERLAAVAERDEEISVEVKEFSILDILVDNLGRINYGRVPPDRKGITGFVRLNGEDVHGWSIFGFGDDVPERAEYEDEILTDKPVVLRGTFDVDSPADTFIVFPGFTRGCAYLNGFCLGRYRVEGPQKTLYIPASLLRKGENELVVLECEGFENPVVKFTNKIDLG